MSGKGSKVKGSVFERLVAKKIIAAANAGLASVLQNLFGRKDCYRTPLSGGHEFAGASDLIISEDLRKYFSFCVECKHRKNFRLDHAVDMVKDFVGYHEQVLEACKREENRRAPMVVIRGQGGRIYAAIGARDGMLHGPDFDDLQERGTVISYVCASRRWTMADLDVMLAAIFKKELELAA